MIKTIHAFAYQSDHGDGGGSTTIYGSLEALREERFNPEDYGSIEEAEKAFQGALNRDSMYEYGEISKISFDIEEINGDLKLVGEIYCSWGQ